MLRSSKYRYMYHTTNRYADDHPGGPGGYFPKPLR